MTCYTFWEEDIEIASRSGHQSYGSWLGAIGAASAAWMQLVQCKSTRVVYEGLRFKERRSAWVLRPATLTVRGSLMFPRFVRS